ncbi:hypothetical protein [Blastococcus sp. TF02A-30]|uniref:hypothetical protein n=1 Tax=Blastococcus sp. TF02A-30 TaxID=2250580 RepID=UPI0013143015|nr:hypothetical protein [Blastococcus sp. TF02A-30]
MHPSSSPPPDDEPDHPTGMSSGAGRKRGRLLIPAVFIAVIVLVFLFIVLVSQIGR